MIDRKSLTLIICCILFMGSLIVADFTSVKLAGIELFGNKFFIPMGTFAFAITFWCTDIIGELYGRAYALTIVVTGWLVRILLMFYVFWVIGDISGVVSGLNMPEFWTSENQSALSFVFSQSINIFVAGVIAIILGSLLDVYVYHFFKEKHKNKNLFWLRNNISTFCGQTLNSVLFVTIAFHSFLTPKQLFFTILGQIIIKFLLAIFIDTPLAYLLRNFGQEKENWYKFWKFEFWQG